MYKILIAEDEKLVRIGLKHSFDWGKYDMTIISDVGNGLDAYNGYTQTHPDVMIIDIKMPEMDGMELLRKIRENDSYTKIIILSCLDDFEIARQAMNLGASGYLLKLTMTNEEMDKLLGKVYRELEEEKKTRPEISSEHIDTKIKKHKRNIIYKYLNYDMYTDSEFASWIEQLDINIDPSCMVVCYGKFFNSTLDIQKESDGVLIDSYVFSRETMMDLIRENIGGICKNEVIPTDDMGFILIISFSGRRGEKAIHEENFQIFNRIDKSVNDYFNTSLYLGISDIQSGIHGLKRMLAQAKTAVAFRFFYSQRHFLVYKDIDIPVIKERMMKHLLNAYMNAGINNMVIEQRYTEKAAALAQDISLHTECPKRLREGLCGLLQWIINALKSWDDRTSSLLIDSSREILNAYCLEDLLKAFDKFMTEMGTFYKLHGNLNDHIKVALSYIEENYNKEIMLQDVANHINLSPGYLSSLFKNELKENFIDYVNRMKIEKAKELLSGTPLKSYEIAEKIGFADHTYFSKWFKKFTGMSPSSFRKEFLEQ